VHHCFVSKVDLRTSWNEGDVLLPVSKWLVAKEPIPLSIPGITDAVVCVEGVGGVVCVQAAKISGIQIAVFCAV
jgi:hypothetical protein